MDNKIWPLSDLQIGGYTYNVSEEGDPLNQQDFAVVRRDGKEIYRIQIRPPAGSSALKGFWAWNGQWVLEVEGHIILNSEDLNKRLDAQETFAWQVLDGKPFYFYSKGGKVYAWYGGEALPIVYDAVVHNTCCEAGAFDVGHNAQMVWFYAQKDGIWRYVELGRFAP